MARLTTSKRDPFPIKPSPNAKPDKNADRAADRVVARLSKPKPVR
jgi:hypothetical protein